MSTSASYFTENIHVGLLKVVSFCILDILASISSFSTSNAKQNSKKSTLSEWLVTFTWGGKNLWWLWRRSRRPVLDNQVRTVTIFKLSRNTWINLKYQGPRDRGIGFKITRIWCTPFNSDEQLHTSYLSFFLHNSNLRAINCPWTS